MLKPIFFVTFFSFCLCASGSSLDFPEDLFQKKLLIITPDRLDLSKIFPEIGFQNIAIIIPDRTENITHYKESEKEGNIPFFKIIPIENYFTSSKAGTKLIELWKNKGFKFNKIICTRRNDFFITQEAMQSFKIGGLGEEDRGILQNKSLFLRKVREAGLKTVLFSPIPSKAHLYEFKKNITVKEGTFFPALLLENISAGQEKSVVGSEEQLGKYVERHDKSLSDNLAPLILATIELQSENGNRYHLQGLIKEDSSLCMLVFLNGEQVAENHEIREYCMAILDILPQLKPGYWFALEVFKLNNTDTLSKDKKSFDDFIFCDFLVQNDLVEKNSFSSIEFLPKSLQLMALRLQAELPASTYVNVDLKNIRLMGAENSAVRLADLDDPTQLRNILEEWESSASMKEISHDIGVNISTLRSFMKGKTKESPTVKKQVKEFFSHIADIRITNDQGAHLDFSNPSQLRDFLKQWESSVSAKEISRDIGVNLTTLLSFMSGRTKKSPTVEEKVRSFLSNNSNISITAYMPIPIARKIDFQDHTTQPPISVENATPLEENSENNHDIKSDPKFRIEEPYMNSVENRKQAPEVLNPIPRRSGLFNQ